MPTEQNNLENDRDHMDPVHSALRHLNYFYIDFLKSNLKELLPERKMLFEVKTELLKLPRFWVNFTYFIEGCR